MMLAEKQQLLELLDRESRWCQHVEARDGQGTPVLCDADSATAWDVTGAIYRLFGWDRAADLYIQLDRHIHGKRRRFGWPLPPEDLEAMTALQAFNDRPDTSFHVLRAQLEGAPVWTGEKRPHAVARPTPVDAGDPERASERRLDGNQGPILGSET